jgi:hypothetical protein
VRSPASSPSYSFTFRKEYFSIGSSVTVCFACFLFVVGFQYINSVNIDPHLQKLASITSPLRTLIFHITMRSSLWITSLLATIALAAPQYSSSGDADALQTYFELLASKVEEGLDMAAAPVCDLSKAQMPSSSKSIGTALAVPN